MRCVKLDNCPYSLFSVVRDTLLSTIPHAIISIQYSPDLSVATFSFWDSEYIPACLRQFVMQPPQVTDDEMEAALNSAVSNYASKNKT